jgi:hypothetical protein
VECLLISDRNKKQSTLKISHFTYTTHTHTHTHILRLTCISSLAILDFAEHVSVTGPRIGPSFWSVDLRRLPLGPTCDTGEDVVSVGRSPPHLVNPADADRELGSVVACLDHVVDVTPAEHGPNLPNSCDFPKLLVAIPETI